MSDNRLSPRESGKFVSSLAKHVFIVDSSVMKAAETVADAVARGELDYDASQFEDRFPTKANLTLTQLMNWSFIINAINFSHWIPATMPRYVVSHDKQKKKGYPGLVTAFKRAIAEGKPIYDPECYGNLSMGDVHYLFRSLTTTKLPLLRERQRIFTDVAKTLKEKYKGCFSNVVKQAENDALKLVSLITSDFECFQDFAVYERKEVSFLGKSLAVASDLNFLLSMNDLPGLKNIDCLTMFADYRIPQILLYYGILDYSSELKMKLEQEARLENGGLEEVEIRACSIEAVERLVEETKKVLATRKSSAEINAVKVDAYLWNYRVQHSKEFYHVPYHKTRCIYY